MTTSDNLEVKGTIVFTKIPSPLIKELIPTDTGDLFIDPYVELSFANGVSLTAIGIRLDEYEGHEIVTIPRLIVEWNEGKGDEYAVGDMTVIDKSINDVVEPGSLDINRQVAITKLKVYKPVFRLNVKCTDNGIIDDTPIVCKTHSFDLEESKRKPNTAFFNRAYEVYTVPFRSPKVITKIDNYLRGFEVDVFSSFGFKDTTRDKTTMFYPYNCNA